MVTSIQKLNAEVTASKVGRGKKKAQQSRFTSLTTGHTEKIEAEKAG
jgi:hypothetical protein